MQITSLNKSSLGLCKWQLLASALISSSENVIILVLIVLIFQITSQSKLSIGLCFIPHIRSTSITCQYLLALTTTTERSKNGNQETPREMSVPRGFGWGMII
jgi:hypothetical protein